MGKGFYAMPYRIINPVWARLGKPATAVLPVLGSYMNDRKTKVWPGMKTLCRQSGYKEADKVREGIKELVDERLIELCWHWRGGKRFRAYRLMGKAVYTKELGKSYLIFGKKMRERWADLKPCEQRVYMPLLMKAELRDSDEDIGVRANGAIKERRLREMAGISRRSVPRALAGLVEKDWIGLDEESPGDWIDYWITTTYLG